MDAETDGLAEALGGADDAAPTESRSSVTTAPYMSYTGFKNLLEKLGEDGVPGRFDKSYFGNISGSLVAQTRQTLRYFELIDDEQHPQDVLKQLVNADETGRKQILLAMFNEKYPDALALSPNATSGQLSEVFRERGLSGATVVKAMNFFLGMADEVGVTLSPHFKKGRVSAASNGSRRKRAPKAPAQTVQPPSIPPPATPVTSKEAQRAKYVDMLMTIAAKSEGEMPSQELLDRIERAIGLDTGEPQEAPVHDSP